MNCKLLKAYFHIPRGEYCHGCPYWGIDKTRPYQENGYCSFLGKGDWELEGFSLLWDQCKECGIKL